MNYMIMTLLILLSLGCSRKIQETSVIQLTLPSGGMSSSKITEFKYSEPMSMQSASAYGDDDDGAEWNPALNPENLGAVNCYMIAVAGPEADMQRNTCVTTSGQNLKVGRWAGGIPAGTTLSLEVPAGSQREITVIGFKATAGACTNFKNTDVNGMGLSEPHVLGKITKDLTPGNVAVTVPVTVNAATLKIDDCAGPDFNMEHAPLYFGDKASGLTTVATALSYTSAGGVSKRLVGLNPAPVSPNEHTTFLETTSNGFTVGDEVMIIVQGLRGAWTGSGNHMVGPCGYRAWEGRYAFARVMETSTTPPGIYISKGTFVDKLDYDPATSTTNAIQLDDVVTRMLVVANSSADFCRIKVAKVLHYYDLTINTAVGITASSFGYDDDNTGILPLRVSNNLTFNGTAYLSASSSGYTPALNKHGSGVSGAHLVTCSTAHSDTGTGGTCSVPASGNGAGGGGHGNTSGSPFGFSGGDGGDQDMTGPRAGGNGAGEDCGDGSCFGNLSHKMFLGGAGGSGTTLGGLGGGIVYVMAKNVVVAPSATPNISADGGIPNNTISPQAGAPGGGAGGSIVFGFQNMNLPLTSTLSANANGSVGGVASGSLSSGGGGGAGGRIHITRCLTGVNVIGTFTQSAIGGAGGSGSVNPGAPGLAGSIIDTAVPCN